MACDGQTFPVDDAIQGALHLGQALLGVKALYTIDRNISRSSYDLKEYGLIGLGGAAVFRLFLFLSNIHLLDVFNGDVRPPRCLKFCHDSPYHFSRCGSLLPWCRSVVALSCKISRTVSS